MVGLIRKDDEQAYREEVRQLVEWCNINNLVLNVSKTKEIIVDFRKDRTHTPLHINNAAVEITSSTKFLGVEITDDLKWTPNTTCLVKKAQKRLYFLRRMRRAHLPSPILITFYRSTIESVLTSCISLWFWSCNEHDRKAVQRVVRTAEKITGTSLPSIQDVAERRCLSRAQNIAKDPTHPHHELFSLLPSGRRFRSALCRTERFFNSFLPNTIRLSNSN